MEPINQAMLEDIKHVIIIDAPVQKVWDFVATSEGIASWFMPNDFQPEEENEFHLQSPFGPSPCKVTEFDPPNRLSFTWDTEGWIVSFLLTEIEGKTEFTLIHGGWKHPEAILPKANEKSFIIRDRMDHGWEGIVRTLNEKVVEA
ncbi:SRPBCC family protein [Planococcus sp. 1R117A]|uniref:SRPBCC family protein n=1 Tax=Planococcus sp. 1R117A TaxID=3447020 RepID=UPI003EDC4651